MTARDEVLGRIRTALGGEPGGGAHPPADPSSAGYRTHGELDQAALLDLLAGRLIDYRSQVRRTEPDKLLDTVRAALAERGARRVVLPPGLDLPGLSQPGPGQSGPGQSGPGQVGTLDGVELITDGGLSAGDLDQMDGVITRAAVAIAETGTIVLDAGPGQGRRALTLIPDYHLCLIEAGQVVALVPEGVARLRPDRPLTWISGPSATSDIELERVEGVHGPRTLEVILISTID
ncbi:MAG TPA: LUD domain-containing protein [Streptosporangiaceae bacterium]|nr:LUD domain-containing protein [Streptosporangiaceae bacterium]